MIEWRISWWSWCTHVWMVLHLSVTVSDCPSRGISVRLSEIYCTYHDTDSTRIWLPDFRHFWSISLKQPPGPCPQPARHEGCYQAPAKTFLFTRYRHTERIRRSNVRCTNLRTDVDVDIISIHIFSESFHRQMLLLYVHTVEHWPVHLCCRPVKSPKASLFLQRLPRPASGSPLHCWQPSIFGCWPSHVELPATTGGYVSAISDNLPHSTRDVSVH